jgi:hypothetical protein
MQPLAPGGLAEGNQAQSLQALLQLEGGLDHAVARNIRRGIKVKDVTSRKFGLAWRAIPRVQFDGRGLGHGSQAFDPI